MTGSSPIPRFRQLGTALTLAGMLLGSVSTAYADFSDGNIPATSSTVATGSGATAGTAYAPSATVQPQPGCAAAQQQAVTNASAYGYGTSAAFIQQNIKPPVSIWDSCDIPTIMQMYSSLSSLFTGANFSDIWNTIGTKLAQAVMQQACGIINSTVSSAVSTTLGSVAGTGAAGSVLSSVAGGALYGGQAGVGNALVGAAGSQIGSTLGTSLGGSTLGNSAVSIYTTGQSAVTSNLGLATPAPAPSTSSVLQQIIGGSSTTTTTTTPTSGGLY